MKATLICSLLTAYAGVGSAQHHPIGVIAHRGAWKISSLPQNSVASLKHAAELGCFGSEFDVHITKDDEMVVNHDKDFYGILVETSDYKAILAKEHPNGEPIPTAEAFIREGMKQKGTKLIFELKALDNDKDRTLHFAHLAVALVKKLHAQEWIEYICFDYDACKLIKQLDPDAKVAYLSGDKSPAEVKRDGLTGIDYNFQVYKDNAHWIKEAKQLGLEVNAWTVNDKETMNFLLDHGVDYITTDVPEILFELLAGRESVK